MITQNRFVAKPYDSTYQGFSFTNLESYQTEWRLHNKLNGTMEYEIQITGGNQIDRELFTGLTINQTTLAEWFEDIQHLTNTEKVGLWFLYRWCGYGLKQAMAIIQEGITIYHGSKEGWAGEWLAQTGFFHSISEQFRTGFDTDAWIRECECKGILREFRFAGEKWCANPMIY
jgi:hypothetical protein